MDHVGQLSIAHRQQEVLVAFRGRIPTSLFEVVNPDTGIGKGRLPAMGQALVLYRMDLQSYRLLRCRLYFTLRGRAGICEFCVQIAQDRAVLHWSDMHVPHEQRRKHVLRVSVLYVTASCRTVHEHGHSDVNRKSRFCVVF